MKIASIASAHSLVSPNRPTPLAATALTLLALAVCPSASQAQATPAQPPVPVAPAVQPPVSGTPESATELVQAWLRFVADVTSKLAPAQMDQLIKLIGLTMNSMQAATVTPPVSPPGTPPAPGGTSPFPPGNDGPVGGSGGGATVGANNGGESGNAEGEGNGNASGVTLGVGANTSGSGETSGSPFILGYLQTRPNSVLSLQFNLVAQSKQTGEVDVSGISPTNPDSLRVNALNDQRGVYGSQLLDPQATRGMTFRYSSTVPRLFRKDPTAAPRKAAEDATKMFEAAEQGLLDANKAIGDAESEVAGARNKVTAARNKVADARVASDSAALTTAQIALTTAQADLATAEKKLETAKADQKTVQIQRNAAEKTATGAIKTANEAQDRANNRVQFGFYVRGSVNFNDWQAKITEDAPDDEAEARSRQNDGEDEETPPTRSVDRTVSGQTASLAGGLMVLFPPVTVNGKEVTLAGEPVTIGLEAGVTRRWLIGDLSQETDFREAIFGTSATRFQGWETSLFATSGNTQVFVRVTDFNGGVRGFSGTRAVIGVNFIVPFSGKRDATKENTTRGGSSSLPRLNTSGGSGARQPRL